VNAFRIVLTEGPSYSLDKNMAKAVNYLSYYRLLSLKTFSF